MPVLAQSAARPQGTVDSIVLTRRVDLGPSVCPRCPPPRILLRRADVPQGALDRLSQHASRAGYYSMPVNVQGTTAFCRVAMSDAVAATLRFYHSDGMRSVSGYHRCVREGSATARWEHPPESLRLIALEESIDSVAKTIAARGAK